MTDVGIVLSNLLYLIVALGVALIVALIVVLRHRKPKSVEANVASFHRGLRALAPDRPHDPGAPWGGAGNRVVSRATPTAGGGGPSAPGPSVGPSVGPEPAAGPEPSVLPVVPDDDPELVAADPPPADPLPAQDPLPADDPLPAQDPLPADDPAVVSPAETSEVVGPGAVPGTPSGPVHFAPKKRRPVLPSVDDEKGAPTEEAGTG